MINIKSSDKSNIVYINKSNKFINSSIQIKGVNNSIKIEKCTYEITNLNIELRGNNNKVIISNTTKKINNLFIQSIRAGYTEIFIDENFGCGGVDIRMNDGYEKIFIGKDCLFSWGIKMRTSDGHSVIDLNLDKAVNLPADIYIGDHVWMGEDVKILKGIYIPNNCVLGGFSVITKSFSKKDSNSVIAGFPAKVVKSNITWDRKKADEYNNNLRLLDYKHKEIIVKNKVNLKINDNQINYSWNTIITLEDVILKSKTILEIFYNYEKSLDDMIFQILLWDNKDTYFWNIINFQNQKIKKGVCMVDFSLLNIVGEMKYKNVKYVEIRAKRIRK